MTARSQWKFFSKAEAEAKVGQWIQARKEYLDIPEDTVGRVVNTGPSWIATSIGKKGEIYGVAVEWDMPKPKPLEDWFTKDQYERFLDEVGNPDALD